MKKRHIQYSPHLTTCTLPVSVWVLPVGLEKCNELNVEAYQLIPTAGALPKGYLTFRIAEEGVVKERGKIQIY